MLSWFKVRISFVSVSGFKVFFYNIGLHHFELVLIERAIFIKILSDKSSLYMCRDQRGNSHHSL